MAFSRMAAKAKPAPAPASAEDPEAAAWQAQLAKEREEQERSAAQAQANDRAKIAMPGAKNRADEDQRYKVEQAKQQDAVWKEAHKSYSKNVNANIANMSSQGMDEEKARQQRIERSKAEAAKRAMAGTGGADVGAPRGFAWKKQAPAAPAGGGYNSRAAPPSDMGDLPSHDDCELAVSAMVSRTLPGMKEGLRQLGLPDYPLNFIPGKEFHLCGHDLREVINEMIHAWMTDEKDDFYNVLLRIKSIVADPIMTEEEMAYMQHQEAFNAGARPENSPLAQNTVGVDQAAKPKPAVVQEDSDDEVIDLSSAPPGRKEEPARPGQHSFAKPVPSAPVGNMDDEDLYGLLGITSSATLQEIRMKFRTLVISEHPEKGGDPKKFAKLNKAYGILSDQEKRRQYDEKRS